MIAPSMKICLATMHATPAFTPLALRYLKAHLVERCGHALNDVEILEFARDVDQADVVRLIVAAEPTVLGLSCYVWNVTALLAVCAGIKALRPDTTIVLGGPEVGPEAASVLAANPAVDAIVASEGEIPFAEIVETLTRRGDLACVKGICFRRGTTIVENEDAPLLRDLNQLASPHAARYGDGTGRLICLETQRGCVFHCSFCFENKGMSVRNRRFNLDRLKEEILFWLQQDVSEIYFMDPVFNLDAERTKEICRFIVQHNARKIGMHAELWAEFIDEEMARLFHDAGFHFLEVGLQTTDETALSAVERRLRLKPFLEGIGYLQQFNLQFELQLICGLPGDTLAMFKKSIDFAGSLDPYSLAVYPLMILPGTELRRKAAEIALDFDPNPPYHVRSHASMSPGDVQYGQEMVNALDLLGNARTIRTLIKETGVTLSAVIDAWIDWRQRHTASDAEANLVAPFLLAFCEERRIPTAFYRASAAVEFNGKGRRELPP